MCAHKKRWWPWPRISVIVIGRDPIADLFWLVNLAGCYSPTASLVVLSTTSVFNVIEHDTINMRLMPGFLMDSVLFHGRRKKRCIKIATVVTLPGNAVFATSRRHRYTLLELVSFWWTMLRTINQKNLDSIFFGAFLVHFIQWPTIGRI